MDEAIDPITGDINWACECLGNNTKGPCADLFKRAFTLFVKSQKDHTIDFSSEMAEMQKCMSKHPQLYE